MRLRRAIHGKASDFVLNRQRIFHKCTDTSKIDFFSHKLNPAAFRGCPHHKSHLTNHRAAGVEQISKRRKPGRSTNLPSRVAWQGALVCCHGGERCRRPAQRTKCRTGGTGPDGRRRYLPQKTRRSTGGGGGGHCGSLASQLLVRHPPTPSSNGTLKKNPAGLLRANPRNTSQGCLGKFCLDGVFSQDRGFRMGISKTPSQVFVQCRRGG